MINDPKAGDVVPVPPVHVKMLLVVTVLEQVPCVPNASVVFFTNDMQFRSLNSIRTELVAVHVTFNDDEGSVMHVFVKCVTTVDKEDA